ncbi:MAG: glycosyltransferase [Caldithrix sp.]|nr:glycosyltransferase [Caldithrix sp.]
MADQPHILYLSQYFPPEMGAPSARVYELSRRWVKAEARVTVLTGFPNHPTGVIPEEYRGYHYLKEKKDGIDVVRTYIYAAPNKGFFKRILSYMSFMMSSIVQGTGKVGEQDVIIATSPQFFVGIAGYIISRLKGLPFIFEVRDLWPESIVQLGLLRNKYAIRFLQWVEMFLYRKALHVVGVADSTYDVLTSRGLKGHKISIIKNGVDLNLFKNNYDADTVKRHKNLQEKFVISYIGTHGLSHALDKVLDTAHLMRNDPDCIFLLVGEGAEKEKLKDKARRLNLNNVIFHDQVGKSELPKFYALSDIVLVTLRKLPLFKQVIPSKIFEIMAMRRPILISVDGEARKIVQDAGAGVFSEPENADKLMTQIQFLKPHADIRAEMGQNGFNYVHEHFNRDRLADYYLNLIKTLLQRRGV